MDSINAIYPDFTGYRNELAHAGAAPGFKADELALWHADQEASG